MFHVAVEIGIYKFSRMYESQCYTASQMTGANVRYLCNSYFVPWGLKLDQKAFAARIQHVYNALPKSTGAGINKFDRGVDDLEKIIPFSGGK